jgi:hypothetical protein
MNKVYCNACGSHNAVGIQKCVTCGCPCEAPVKSNPITSASLSNPKLALFDIDDTLLDPKERFRSAVRAGIVDKEGMPIKEGFNTGWKKRDAFLYRDDMLAKDKVIPNSIELIDHLMKKGYTIAYCTSRSFSHYEVTKAQLESKGFPLFNTPNGDTLLFLKKSRGENAAKYKAGVIQLLQSQYEVTLFFDDKLEIQQAAASVGVPGVYQSVTAYWSLIARTNPYPTYLTEKGEPFYDPDAEPYDSADSHDDDPSGMGRKLLRLNNPANDEYQSNYLDDSPIYTEEEFTTNDLEEAKAMADLLTTEGGYGTYSVYEQYFHSSDDIDRYVVKFTDSFTSAIYEGSRNNPAKRGKDVKGNYFRWGGGKKYYYKAGNKASREKARKAAYGQAKAAFAGGYKKNPANPSKVSKGKKLYKHMNGKEPAKVEKKTIDIGDVWYQVGEGGCWQIGYRSGKETGSSNQKYVHNFNEETKDGNFPKLYATIPDDGKPMLIITGGTWKIKTDENNIAWIYD